MRLACHQLTPPFGFCRQALESVKGPQELVREHALFSSAVSSTVKDLVTLMLARVFGDVHDAHGFGAVIEPSNGILSAAQRFDAIVLDSEERAGNGLVGAENPGNSRFEVDRVFGQHGVARATAT